MKLHYTKILLFFFPLNILVISYQVHSKNKIYITPHHIPIYISRVLSECDIQSSIYDNDADMKSVKERFDDRTSQRFEEYEERMKDKRQKRKEERDKNIQKIVEKDKMEKSLVEKVEIGCLRCGCSLGGVAASVGIFGAVAVNEVTKAALLAAPLKGIEAGIEAGVKAAITQIKLSSFIRTSSLVVEWPNFINRSNYNTVDGLVDAVTNAMNSIEKTSESVINAIDRVLNGITANKTYWLREVAEAGEQATTTTTTLVEKAEIAAANSKSTYLFSAIGYSVLAILIIVLVMIIIYLILRYLRKKK
ncbi:rifin, partial [Plasmodium reichenowi]